jgi:hypothetical protein
MDGNLRAELLSPSLISDMRAFKAANPGCEFVDFLRWFSPKDVVVADESKAPLASPRMLDGLWLQTWTNSAPPLEASKQKKLFDPVVVGEKALHWLETLSLDAVCGNLLEEAVVGLKMLVEEHQKVAQSNGYFPSTWSPLLQALQQAHDAASVLAVFPALEARTSRVDELRKVSDVVPGKLIQGLIDGDGSVTVTVNAASSSSTFGVAGEDVAQFLLKKIGLDRGDCEHPDKREYLILAGGNHRLYGSTSHGELRVARILDWK